MVIPHWSHPTTVLAELGSVNARAFALTAVTTIVEPSRAFNRSQSGSDSAGLWAKFEGLASTSANTDAAKSHSVDYGKTDHEIRFFVDPLMFETVSAIANLPAVRTHMNSGMFGKRAVVIVTGLRIAMSSFTVKGEDSSNFSIEAEGSGLLLGTGAPEVGASIKHARIATRIDLVILAVRRQRCTWPAIFYKSSKSPSAVFVPPEQKGD